MKNKTLAAPAPRAPRLLCALILTLAGAAALAAPTSCARFYAGGKAPDIVKPTMQAKTRELCYAAFGVMHSGITRTPLWSAEKLTKAQIQKAKGLDRQDTFRPEERLPESDRAELEDYKGSGWDRGHLSPNGNMPDRDAQSDSFVLANMVPQAGWANRGQWSDLESAVRQRVMAGRTLNVITGPLFEGKTLEQLNRRVMIPSAIFKVVCDVKSKQIGVYVLDNRKEPVIDPRIETPSLKALEARLGIRLLPGVPDAYSFAPLKLTLPNPSGKIRWNNIF